MSTGSLLTITEPEIDGLTRGAEQHAERVQACSHSSLDRPADRECLGIRDRD
jgi:hypothetical protein